VKTAIELLSLLLVGWIAGAELGSWCCVQPVVARLPYEQFVAAEQGMLRTFGRIMPVLMPLSGILVVALIILSRGDTRFVFWLRVAVAFCIAVTVVTTLLVNVPINTQTAGWQLTKILPRGSRCGNGGTSSKACAVPYSPQPLCSWRFRSCRRAGDVFIRPMDFRGGDYRRR
jgi:uncharacterized membrane protein